MASKVNTQFPEAKLLVKTAAFGKGKIVAGGHEKSMYNYRLRPLR